MPDAPARGIPNMNSVVARLLCAGLLLMMFLGLTACARDPEVRKEKDLKTLTDKETEVILSQAAKMKPGSGGPEVAVSAYVEGRFVHVAVENRTEKTLIVGPKNIGVATADGKIARFEAHEPGFPITKLLPKDRIE